MMIWRRYLIISIILILSLLFPRPQDESQVIQTYHQIQQSLTLPISVMTFNIRYDGWMEYFKHYHWTKRISAVSQLFTNYSPSIFGIQECLYDQHIHFKSLISNEYTLIGNNGQYQGAYQTAIGINTTMWKIEERDHRWLTDTPDIESKQWGSDGARTITTVRISLHSNSSIQLIVFNTHLDVKNAEARYQQAYRVIQHIQTYQQRYPHLPILVLGDFNSVPGHAAYRVLTDTLNDVWNTCWKSDTCHLNTATAVTIHAWLGSHVNTYLGRLISWIGFIFHGLQDSSRWYWSLPTEYWPFRLHIDWILYAQPRALTHDHTSTNDLNSKSSTNRLELVPHFVSVVDVRPSNCSSDHFPVVALFSLQQQAYGAKLSQTKGMR